MKKIKPYHSDCGKKKKKKKKKNNKKNNILKNVKIKTKLNIDNEFVTDILHVGKDVVETLIETLK